MSIRKSLITILLVFCCISLFASASKRSVQSAFTMRTSLAHHIESIIEPEIMVKARPITGFLQYGPVYKAHSSHWSEARILFDDKAVYLAPILYGPSPDRILRQLGRQDAVVNADAFGIRFETNNNQPDAYTFSSLNLVWKNAILHEQSGAVAHYNDNFNQLLNSPQHNSLLLKILYYLDYQQIRGA